MPRKLAFFVLFSCSVVSNSLSTHGLQHAKLPCPSLTRRTCSNSCPLSRWCYLTVSSSVAPYSFCFQSFPALGCFEMNQLFTSGGQSIGVSASASVLPMYIQDWSFRIDSFDLLAVQGTLESLLQHHILKASVLHHSAFSMVQLSHLYMTTGKTIALIILTFVSKVRSLLFIHCLGLS